MKFSLSVRYKSHYNPLKPNHPYIYLLFAFRLKIADMSFPISYDPPPFGLSLFFFIPYNA